MTPYFGTMSRPGTFDSWLVTLVSSELPVEAALDVWADILGLVGAHQAPPPAGAEGKPDRPGQGGIHHGSRAAPRPWQPSTSRQRWSFHLRHAPACFRSILSERAGSACRTVRQTRNMPAAIAGSLKLDHAQTAHSDTGAGQTSCCRALACSPNASCQLLVAV